MPDPRPNIVLVLADDLGCCDLGCYGNTDVQTPHIDALAGASLRHQAFYVTPVCAPTRAALLTGRHHLRTGVSHVHGGHDYLHRDETTIAETLRAAGYATGMWGKWHSGTDHGYLPEQRGFDEAVRLRLYKHRDPVTIVGDEPTAHPGRWGDEVIVEGCLDFAERHRDQPFFAYVASMTPHGPLDGPEERVAHYRSAGLTENLARHYALVELLDGAVGRLRAGLDTLDLKRETIVVFASDNGPAMHEGILTDAERERRNVLGWRGWKGDVWEAGIRSPLFVHAPGRFGVREEHQVADVTDLYPTFCAWAGAEPRADQLPVDGRDISPMLAGNLMDPRSVHVWVHPAIPPYEGPRDRREALDEYRPHAADESMPAAEQVMAIRHGDWKLVRGGDVNQPDGALGVETLHRVVADPGEQDNLIASEQTAAATLRQRLDGWWQEIRREPHAFAPPVQVLPGTSAGSFRAVACCALQGGLRNGVGAISGVGAAGQRVDWLVDVPASRVYDFQFDWANGRQPPIGTRFRLGCGDGWVEGEQSANGVHWQEPLMIDAGSGTLSLQILEWPSDEEAALAQVRWQC